MKKIIVPVDFSDLSRHALHFAVEFAEKIGGSITLLHVLEYPLTLFTITGQSDKEAIENFYPPEFIARVKEHLNEWKERNERENVSIEILLKYGNSFQKISESVTEEDANYIVMGSKGASGLKEIFIGSNAARMVRFAKCPVIIIKGETHLKDFESLVFATDGTIEQDEIARKVHDLQQLLHLPLHLLKVKTPYNWLEDVQVKQQLTHFAERNSLAYEKVDFVIADFIDEGAVKYAEENKSGLIVIGTHGRTGLRHLIGGSTAEALVNESTIPVVVFRLSH